MWTGICEGRRPVGLLLLNCYCVNWSSYRSSKREGARIWIKSIAPIFIQQRTQLFAFYEIYNHLSKNQVPKYRDFWSTQKGSNNKFSGSF